MLWFANRSNFSVFGSTANGFGTVASDMDMCITPPPGVSSLLFD